MTVIKVDKLKVGMELVSDVNDLTGRTLLKTGAKITKKHLTIFKSWGITEADVEGFKNEDIDDHIGKELSPESLAKAKAEVSALFSNSNLSHPAIKELFNLCMLKKSKSGNKA